MRASNLNTSNKKNKIIWAVDPTQNPKDALSLVKELKTWSKYLNCEVQPVAIFSNNTLSFPTDLGFPWKENFENGTRKSLDSYIKKTHTKDFLPAERLFVPTLSTRKMAAELAKYAEKNKALYIFANTRASKAWNPMRLGNFAETLVTASKIPVVLMGPSASASAKVPSILFPTNFNHESKNALMNLAPLAQSLNSKILLYSQIEMPNIYSLEYSGPAQSQLTSIDSIIKKLETSRTKKAEEWTNLLQNQNIKSSLVIQRQKKYLGEEIIAAAKKNKISLIVMSSHRGPLAQAILGSVPRDVIMKAQCPVLIYYRPKGTRKKFVEIEQKTRRVKPAYIPQPEVYHG